MKRFLPVLFVLLVPATMFAQGRRFDENAALKNLRLNDTQITQVVAPQKSTREATHADLTHIRLIKAQIAEAGPPRGRGKADGSRRRRSCGPDGATYRRGLAEGRGGGKVTLAILTQAA